MKLSKRMLFGIIACALAVLLVVVGIPLINTASDPKVKIVRAVANIDKGTPITADKLAYVEVSSAGLPAAVITNAADILDKYALVDIVPGDYFLPAKISSYQPVDTSIYSTLGDGIVAVSIEAPNFVGMLANQVQEGDIVSFYSVSDKSVVFELQYVLISELLNGEGVSVNDVSIDEDTDGKSTKISAITFSVTEQQAAALLKLQYGGTVHFELICRDDPNRAEKLLAKQQAMLERAEEARADILDSYLRLFDETYDPDKMTLPVWYRQNVDMELKENSHWADIMKTYDNNTEDEDDRMETDRAFYTALIEELLTDFNYHDTVNWDAWEEEWDYEWEETKASLIPIVEVETDTESDTEEVEE